MVSIFNKDPPPASLKAAIALLCFLYLGGVTADSAAISVREPVGVVGAAGAGAAAAGRGGEAGWLTTGAGGCTSTGSGMAGSRILHIRWTKLLN